MKSPRGLPPGGNAARAAVAKGPAASTVAIAALLASSSLFDASAMTPTAAMMQPPAFSNPDFYMPATTSLLARAAAVADVAEPDLEALKKQ
eukprot:3530005-Prymnesium_polylepis.1